MAAWYSRTGTVSDGGQDGDEVCKRVERSDDGGASARQALSWQLR